MPPRSKEFASRKAYFSDPSPKWALTNEREHFDTRPRRRSHPPPRIHLKLSDADEDADALALKLS
jgi:hypothetical protein